MSQLAQVRSSATHVVLPQFGRLDLTLDPNHPKQAIRLRYQPAQPGLADDRLVLHYGNKLVEIPTDAASFHRHRTQAQYVNAVLEAFQGTNQGFKSALAWLGVPMNREMKAALTPDNWFSKALQNSQHWWQRLFRPSPPGIDLIVNGHQAKLNTVISSVLIPQG
jgi:hypothetical protein